MAPRIIMYTLCLHLCSISAVFCFGVITLFRYRLHIETQQARPWRIHHVALFIYDDLPNLLLKKRRSTGQLIYRLIALKTARY